MIILYITYIICHSALCAPKNVRSAAQKEKKETIIAHTTRIAHSMHTEAFHDDRKNVGDGQLPYLPAVPGTALEIKQHGKR